jgi:hypothetical protein
MTLESMFFRNYKLYNNGHKLETIVLNSRRVARIYSTVKAIKLPPTIGFVQVGLMNLAHQHL